MTPLFTCLYVGQTTNLHRRIYGDMKAEPPIRPHRMWGVTTNVTALLAWTGVDVCYLDELEGRYARFLHPVCGTAWPKNFYSHRPHARRPLFQYVDAAHICGFYPANPAVYAWFVPVADAEYAKKLRELWGENDFKADVLLSVEDLTSDAVKKSAISLA